MPAAAGEARMASDWVRDDYILHGTPCSRSNVRSLLEIARLVSGGSCLILASVDERSILKRLCLIADEDPDRGERLESRLQDKATNRRAALRSNNAEAIASDLMELTEIQSERLSSQLIQVQSHGLDSRDTAIGVVLLVFGDERTMIKEDWLRELHLRINATIYADIRRDHIAARKVQSDSRLPATAATVAETYQESIESLLSLMCDVSGSDGAAYYRLDGPLAGLALDRSSPPEVDCPLPRFAPYSLADEQEGTTLQRLLSKSLTSSSIMFGTDAIAANGDLEVVATAVPAIALGKNTINQGVITIWSFDKGAKRFDRSQLGWLRNVALRLSLLETSFEAEESASEIAALSRQISSPSNPGLDPGGPLMARGEPVPHDLRHVLPSWQELVGRVRDATRSASVTIRVVRHRRVNGRLEVSLVRFASSPKPADAEPAEEIYVTGHPPGEITEYWRTSLNAFVAFTGEPVYLYDLGRALNRQGVQGLKSILSVPGRPMARSTICLPIVVDGTLVGTMNLESPFVDAYSHLKNTIAAFASLAETSLAMVRQRIGHQLSLSSTISGLSVHDIRNIERRLHETEEQLSTSGASVDLQPVLDSLRPVRARPIHSNWEPNSDSRLDIIIDAVLEQRRQLEKVVPRIEVYISKGIAIPAQNVEPTAKVFDELLENVAVHHDINRPTPIPTIRNAWLFYGGRPYEVIHLENMARIHPSPAALSRLYSSGVEFGDQRPHLGCYVIGQLVRGMGGSVFATAERNGRTSPTVFRTTLLLPRF